jgi:hypothetical protein
MPDDVLTPDATADVTAGAGGIGLDAPTRGA